MKLALNGQWSDVSGMIYAYPDKLPLASDSRWANSIFDPRVVRNMFKGDYCYAIWFNENGYYYSCIKTNTDARNGCVMLTLFAGEMVPCAGKQLVEKLRSLLDYCLSRNSYTEIDCPDFVIKANGIAQLLVKGSLPESARADASVASQKGNAYRLYGNENDLGLILENPNQSSYASYKCILLFEKSAFKGTDGQPVTEISEPVKKNYEIFSDSREVSADKPTVMEGDSFIITYRKTGFADECVDVSCSEKPSKYYLINDNNVINLKSAAEAGISFRRELTLQVVDDETNQPLTGWTCTGLNDKDSVKHEDGRVTYRVEDSKQSRKIVISAQDYEEKILELVPDEHSQKTVRLCPLDVSVFIRLQLNKKDYCGSVKMKSNNNLYGPLKKIDEHEKVLQVKRPFFSRRNLVPILALIAVAAMAGFFGGKAIRKDAKIQQESTKVVEDTVQNNKPEEEKQTIDASLLSSFGNVLALISEKNAIDAVKVTNILKEPDFEGLLNGSVKNMDQMKASLDSLSAKLNAMTEADNAETDLVQKSDNLKVKSEENKVKEDLKYFSKNEDLWDLSQIKSDKYKKFVDYIKNGNGTNLKVYKGPDENENYYNNKNWKTICEALNKYYGNGNKSFGNLEGKIKAEADDGNFDLKAICNYLEQEE